MVAVVFGLGRGSRVRRASQSYTNVKVLRMPNLNLPNLRIMSSARLILFAALTAACQVDVEEMGGIVSDSAGVEIVRVERLPALLDPRWEWGTAVELELRLDASEVGAIGIGAGGAGGAPIIYDPAGILPLGADRVLVVDRHGDLVFAVLGLPGGEVLARFGRRGRGPGEVETVGQVTRLDDGRIVVYDSGNRKVLVIGPDGEVEGEEALRFGGFSGQSGVLGGAEVLVEERVPTPAGGFRHGLVRATSGGELVPVLEFPEPPAHWSPSSIQQGRQLWTTLGETIVAAGSDQPSYRIFDATGQLIRRIELPLTRRDLTEREIEVQLREHGSIARSLRPGRIALTNMLYGFNDSIFATYQSALWRAAEDPVLAPGEVVWRLISHSGRYQGSFRIPEDFRPLWLGEAVIWGVQLDSLGEPWLQRRRLEAPEALR